jgi:hypothetical protein
MSDELNDPAIPVKTWTVDLSQMASITATAIMCNLRLRFVRLPDLPMNVQVRIEVADWDKMAADSQQIMGEVLAETAIQP